ncbi:hypothetical protein QYG06_19975 [Xanthomonas euvesicatoria]|uniref:Uncharacterized protein n=3 Tax=Xanthomonas TaxID=338 RepID=A0AB73H1J2_9XANT|nr:MULTISPECIES: hypothetical protein [Xanthomonas]AOY69410.1 hypothetical protein BHE83_22805 [Xanthomonas euvesicatoria pv. vesicatoria str. 85-10]APO88626.1 hypothetical protein BJD11_00150 [Xanthomonas euvesicatoria]KHL63420.1 hypothetical protein XEU66b_02445 [Xanthomonas euvesicatoria]KLB37852.1 hypothetical protein XEUV206_21755 [Xanthomonas euvesicatoria]KLB44581.1 hypothetical protein XEUV259_19240 [Xanthomonas euvesicatoria]
MTPNTDPVDRHQARVYALSAALASVLPYALSRAEDLHDLHDNGEADSHTPDAHLKAAAAYEGAQQLLQEVSIEAASRGLSARDVGSRLAFALELYSMAPFIGQQYGEYALQTAREAVRKWRLGSAGEGTTDAALMALARPLRECLEDYLDLPGITSQYGQVNFDHGAGAVDAYWTLRLAELTPPAAHELVCVAGGEEVEDSPRPGV